MLLTKLALPLSIHFSSVLHSHFSRHFSEHSLSLSPSVAFSLCPTSQKRSPTNLPTNIWSSYQQHGKIIYVLNILLLIILSVLASDGPTPKPKPQFEQFTSLLWLAIKFYYRQKGRCTNRAFMFYYSFPFKSSLNSSLPLAKVQS